MDLAELGAEGDAEVVSIESCPDIPPRPQDGCRVVTGTFAHSSANVINVSIDGLDQPIGCTSNHPFWSEDRQAFVEAGTLRTGERVRTADDELLTVQSIVARKASEAVFNLEVDVEHVYYVSTSGVLVHNSYFTRGKFGRKTRTGPKKWWTNDHYIATSQQQGPRRVGVQIQETFRVVRTRHPGQRQPSSPTRPPGAAQ